MSIEVIIALISVIIAILTGILFPFISSIIKRRHERKIFSLKHQPNKPYEILLSINPFYSVELSIYEEEKLPHHEKISNIDFFLCLKKIRKKLFSYLEKIDWSKKYSSDVSMALEELLLNAKEHARPSGKKLKIKASVRIRAQMISISISDNGKGFDLESVLSTSENKKLSQKRGKGLLSIKNNSTHIEGKDSTVVVHWYDVDNSDTKEYLFDDFIQEDRDEEKTKEFENSLGGFINVREERGIEILTVNSGYFENFMAIMTIRYLKGVNLSKLNGYILDVSKIKKMDPSHGLLLIELFPEIMEKEMLRRKFSVAIIVNDELVEIFKSYEIITKLEKSKVAIYFDLHEALLEK